MFLTLVLVSTPLFLKWYMTIVPDVMNLQDYPTIGNTPPSNTNNFLLQTSINQEITVGYKIYL